MKKKLVSLLMLVGSAAISALPAFAGSVRSPARMAPTASLAVAEALEA